MNVRLRMYKYCYSNKDAIYAKGLFVIWNTRNFKPEFLVEWKAPLSLPERKENSCYAG